ncbi:unnamed protein product [Toxocara canis]|uniref:Inositol-pentakisphosphate 2-kinase n=1 Tax=Toxocara canis TaxID=6265 RepID=A0A183U1H5_TOXCA|nr:unnamed protein product [Toxocara canis]
MQWDSALRVIRPLIYVREKALREFAESNKLPIIAENCPACFEQPKERYRMKQLLASHELIFPRLFSSLRSALRPLLLVNSPITSGMRKLAIDNIVKEAKARENDEHVERDDDETLLILYMCQGKGSFEIQAAPFPTDPAGSDFTVCFVRLDTLIGSPLEASFVCSDRFQAIKERASSIGSSDPCLRGESSHGSSGPCLRGESSLGSSSPYLRGDSSHGCSGPYLRRGSSLGSFGPELRGESSLGSFDSYLRGEISLGCSGPLRAEIPLEVVVSGGAQLRFRRIIRIGRLRAFAARHMGNASCCVRDSSPARRQKNYPYDDDRRRNHQVTNDVGGWILFRTKI